jgi:DNA-binding transcriptional LysR family regulator
MSAAEPLSGRDLAAFVAAVDSGSVQGAADALALTQSAATKRLQALERRLGVRLLQRRSAGVEPTALGRVLYPLAREALGALQAAELAVSASGVAPTLNLYASHTIGETLLPHWLSAFRAVAPGYRITAEIANSEEVVHAVREGAAEVGFVEGPVAMRGLQELEVASDEIRVVVAADHPWARRRSIPLAALATEPLLARESGSGTRAVSLARLAQAGAPLTPALEVSSTEGLKRAVLSGGYTLLSERTVTAELGAGTLAAVSVSGVDLRRPLRAVRRARPALAPPAKRFWEWLERTTSASAYR